MRTVVPRISFAPPGLGRFSTPAPTARAVGYCSSAASGGSPQSAHCRLPTAYCLLFLTRQLFPLDTVRVGRALAAPARGLAALAGLARVVDRADGLEVFGLALGVDEARLDVL